MKKINVYIALFVFFDDDCKSVKIWRRISPNIVKVFWFWGTRCLVFCVC